MPRRTDLKIPYGVSDFKTIRNEGLYYVDKTMFLAKLEERDRFVFFVRPRRFGKSLFVSMLQCYYDRREKPNFEKLFGGLWLGEHPTENRNRYLVLALDFSKAGQTDTESLSKAFSGYLSKRLDLFAEAYPEVFDREFRQSIANDDVGEKYTALVGRAKAVGAPLYLIIDEYDNFTNTLIRTSGQDPYREITHGSASTAGTSATATSWSSSTRSRTPRTPISVMPSCLAMSALVKPRETEWRTSC